MEYKNIYDFKVLDEIKKGTTVFCVDRLNQDVFVVNKTEVQDYCDIVKIADNEPGRFEFYTMIESEDNE